jgi:hypothetical protein
VAAKKKDEKHRNLLDLPTEEWELLDEDAKADRVDFYYEEKKREREEKKREREEKKREREEEKRERKEKKKRKRDEKKAEVRTCRFCPREYGGKGNYGFCSSECREATKKNRKCRQHAPPDREPQTPTQEIAQGRLPQSDLPQKTSKYELS